LKECGNVYTIADYLKYYKGTELCDVHWNVLDNLLCSMLSYIPVDSFEGPLDFNEFLLYASEFKNREKTNPVAPKAYELLKIVRGSKRYKDLKVYNFIHYKNEDVQFGAVTFRIKDETVISFMGTDNSRIGWFENFRLSYEYPTKTHQFAIEYLNRNIKFFENENLYVVGHSKGGNLAMASVMELSKFNFKKIKKVYNFDGPGFKKEEFESQKYKKLSRKLVNIVPSNTTVGTLLNNQNYTVVKCTGVAFSTHIPTTWNVFGEHFVKDKLSGLSKQLNEASTSGLESVAVEKREEAFEAIFKSFEGKYADDFDMSFANIVKFFKNIKNVDPEVSKSIETIADAIVKAQLGIKNKR